MALRSLRKTALVLTSTAFLLTACSQALQVETAVKAKNVILFIGDGMGISTVTAIRIFDGQSKGMNGEENVLPFETFENLALIKTYNLDAQVPDSAGTASAMYTGIKTQIGKVSVREGAVNAGCRDDASVPPVTIMDLAERAGLSTGVVTTTRLTHATPAAFYSHSSSRDFEDDTDLSDEAKQAGCPDIATQLINSDIDLALGGGRRSFGSERRDDNQDLIAAWMEKSDAHKVATNATELTALAGGTDNVLGLVADSHLDFEADRDPSEQPSLEDMTRFAIDNLSARGTGYVLMVEAGRIDHAHHDTNAYRALTDGQAFAKAVQAAIDTASEDTLILVTADHSHVFTIAGYPKRGNPILGLVTGPGEENPTLDINDKPYTTLGYHNGSSPHDHDETLTANMVQDENFKQRTAVHLESETHAGEDVPLYATGPGSNTVHGVMDQTEIFTVMQDALGFDAP